MALSGTVRHWSDDPNFADVLDIEINGTTTRKAVLRGKQVGNKITIGKTIYEKSP